MGYLQFNFRAVITFWATHCTELQKHKKFVALCMKVKRLAKGISPEMKILSSFNECGWLQPLMTALTFTLGQFETRFQIPCMLFMSINYEVLFWKLT